MSTLADLLVVQEHDTVLDQLRHRRAHLPERAALQEVLAEHNALVARHKEVSAQRDEVAAREAGLEKDIAASEARVADIERRMYSGEVSAARDLQAMAHEIETIKGRVSTLEDKALEAIDEREPLDAVIAELEARDGQLLADHQRLQAAIAAAEREIDAEVELEERARATAAEGVPADLLASYEKLRARLGGTGAARLEHGTCMGCHMKLPPTELDRIRHQPPGALVHCEQCGRILVRVD